MAGFTEQMRKRMAAAAREDPRRLRGVGLGAALLGVAIVWASRSLFYPYPARPARAGSFDAFEEMT